MNSRRSAQAIEWKSVLLLYGTVSALILFRTLPFIIWGRENTDSDEALFGLMAKHIAEGRGFPVFRYGLSYLFGISSYLSAPLMWLFGASVALMRLPLLILNLIVGNWMVYLLRRDSRLSRAQALLCALWFLIPSMMACRGLTYAGDGAIESFVFLLITWVLRDRPLVGGLLCGVGNACRPFALYGIPAIFVRDWRLHGFRKALKNGVIWVAAICTTFYPIRYLARRSPFYMGSGVTVYMKRFRFMLEDIRGFFADIVPKTTGFQIQRWENLYRGSHFNPPGLILYLLGCGVFLILLQRAYRNRRALWRRMAEPDLGFAFYLTLIGFVNLLAYVILSPPSDEIRYTYDLLFGMVGLYVLIQQLAKDKRLKNLAVLVVVGVALNNVYAMAVTWGDFREMDREAPSRKLIVYLHAHDIRAGISGDYDSAYNLSFLSDEAPIVTPVNGGFYPPYAAVLRNTPLRNQALIQTSACEGGTLTGKWYVCPVPASF